MSARLKIRGDNPVDYFRAMIVQEIIAIAGKPGLYRILVTNRSNLVVESMLTASV